MSNTQKDVEILKSLKPLLLKLETSIKVTKIPKDIKILVDSLSFVQDMKNTPQDPEWHSEGNVYVHTMMVLEEMFKNELVITTALFLSCLFHDCEKRSTTEAQIIDGKSRIVSPGHATKGARLAQSLLYKAGYNQDTVHSVTFSVKYHGKPIWVIDSEDPIREVISLSSKCPDDYNLTGHNLDTLYKLCLYDIKGRDCEDKESLLLNLALFKELATSRDCYDYNFEFNDEHHRVAYLKFKKPLDYQPFTRDDIPKVRVFCGLPGAGKDSTINKFYRKYKLTGRVISLDDIRREFKIKSTDKSGTGKVVQEAKKRAKKFLAEKVDFLFNATNTTKDLRTKWVDLFMDYGYEVEIVYVHTTYENLIKRNKNRKHPVPIKVIDKLIDKLDVPKLDEAHEVIRFLT